MSYNQQQQQAVAKKKVTSIYSNDVQKTISPFFVGIMFSDSEELKVNNI